MFVNGKSIGKKQSAEHFFYFDVENVGESNILAVSGEYKDESIIRKVDTFNDEYVLKEKGAILNWFEVTAPAGRFSILDPIEEIMKKFRSKLILLMFGLKIFRMMKKNKKQSKYGESKDNGPSFNVDFKKNPQLMEMLGGFSIYRMSGMIGMIGINLTKEQLLTVNKKLNRVKKPSKK